MSKLAIIVSATIVLIFHHAQSAASPQNIMPDVKESSEPANDLPVDENLSIAEPGPTDPNLKFTPPKYYSHHQQLTLRFGSTSELSPVRFTDYLLGFQYLFPKFLSPKWEAGADMIKDGQGHLHAGVRWIHNERDYFRPSYKLSLDHLADADQRLATLAKIDNYFVRLSATLEYVFLNPYSLRFEPEFLFNHKDSHVMITLGLSRGW